MCGSITVRSELKCSTIWSSVGAIAAHQVIHAVIQKAPVEYAIPPSVPFDPKYRFHRSTKTFV